MNLITMMTLDLPVFFYNEPSYPCNLSGIARRFLAKKHLHFFNKIVLDKSKIILVIMNTVPYSLNCLTSYWHMAEFYFFISISTLIKKIWGLLCLKKCYFSFIVQGTSRCITDRIMLCQIKTVLYRWHRKLIPKWDFLMFR